LVIKPLTKRTLAVYSKALAQRHEVFAPILDNYGVPPLWDRKPGFATLLQIILEQQVSLASAKACFDKLTQRVGEVCPENLLALTDRELKAVGFSRQKTAYARYLSESIIAEHLNLDEIAKMPDVEAKAELIKLKGVGEWTSDIYLLMALLRPDVMPRGDIALHEAYRRLHALEVRPSSDEFIHLAEKWKPYRSVAARLLWHLYLNEVRKPRA
jgi:DNA-3-methyladenine glycosylase II